MWQHLSGRQLFRLGWVGALAGLGAWLGKPVPAPSGGTGRLRDSLTENVGTYTHYEAADGWETEPADLSTYHAQGLVLAAPSPHTESTV